MIQSFSPAAIRGRLYLVLPSPEPKLAVEQDVNLMALVLSTPAGGDRLLTLQSRNPRCQCELHSESSAAS